MDQIQRNRNLKAESKAKGLRVREGVEEVGVLREVVAEGVEAEGPSGEGEEEGRVGGEGSLPRGGGDPEAAGGGALGDRRCRRGRRRHLLVVVVVVGGAGARAACS